MFGFHFSLMDIILLISIFVLLLLWIITGGFITEANIYLDKYKDSNTYLNKAWKYTFAVAFMTWFIVALAIIGIVALVFGGGEALGIKFAKSQQNNLKKGKLPNIELYIIIFFLFALSLLIISSVLAVVSYTEIEKNLKLQNGINNNDINKAYTSTKYGFIFGFISVGLALILLLVYIIKYEKDRKNENKLDKLTDQINIQSLMNQLKQ